MLQGCAVGKGMIFILTLLIGAMWGLFFKMLDPSMTLFQCATLALLTTIVFRIGDKE